MAGHVQRREIERTNRKTGRKEQALVWRARYPDPVRGGKAMVQRTFRTKTDADRWLDGQKASMVNGDYVDPRAADTRFEELADWWLANRNKINEKTKLGYESILETHLKPRFGEVRLRHVTFEVVQAYVSELQEQAAPGTVRNIYACLRNILNAGVDRGMVRRSPCRKGIDVPSASQRLKPTILTSEEVRALAEGITPHYGLLVYTAACTGMRAGELGALRRGRVDLLRSTITVAEAVKEVKGELIFGPTKNKGERRFMIPAFLREMFVEHLAQRRFASNDPEALVFTSIEGSTLSHTNFYKRHFRPAVKRALPPEKQGLRFHDLRHTCASLLIELGAHPKSIQEQLGHSSIQVTMNVYGHLLPSVEEALAAALDEKFSSTVPRDAEVVQLAS